MEQSKQLGNFVLAFVRLFHCSAYNALKSHLPFFAAQVILADFPTPLSLFDYPPLLLTNDVDFPRACRPFGS